MLRVRSPRTKVNRAWQRKLKDKIYRWRIGSTCLIRLQIHYCTKLWNFPLFLCGLLFAHLYRLPLFGVHIFEGVNFCRGLESPESVLWRCGTLHRSKVGVSTHRDRRGNIDMYRWFIRLVLSYHILTEFNCLWVHRLQLGPKTLFIHTFQISGFMN